MAKNLEGEERVVEPHEIHETELKSEDECDPMDTREGEEIDPFASENILGKDSSLMPLNRRCLEAHIPRCEMGRKRSLVEVFAVTYLKKDENLDTSLTLDENLVLVGYSGCNSCDYILYDISSENIQLNSLDQLILNGPDHGIEVGDSFGMKPTLAFSLDGLTSRISSKGIWMDVAGFDCFMSQFLETENGFMKVNFAVYSDGLEARLDISISDLNLPEWPQKGIPLNVYGMIKTSNSAITHTQAKSILFDHSKSSNPVAVFPTGEAEIPLPLSRKVTVIPRESDLTVDVSLFVNCTSQDISIMNKSLLFRAEARSNATIEEQIVTGNHGKVKVRVTWVEAMDDGISAKAEEEEVVEDGQGTKEEIYVGEDVDEDAGSKDISDDDHSVGSTKLRRLKSQEDISTRASEHLMTNLAETHDTGIVERKDSNSHQRLKHSLLEVFSVKLVGCESLSLDEIYGFIMIDTGIAIHLLFRRLREDVRKINSEGFVILEGPSRFAWRVCADVHILPFLFSYQKFEFKGGNVRQKYLWRDDDDKYDSMVHKRLVVDVGSIEVRFAVYKDGVEAHLDVMLINCSFSSSDVYGKIVVSNSMLQDFDAKSTIFENGKVEDVNDSVEPGKDSGVKVRSVNKMTLVLSRPIVALPFGSKMKLEFRIFSGGQPIDCPSLEIPVKLTGEFDRTLAGNSCNVVVKGYFLCEQPRQTFDYGAPYI